MKKELMSVYNKLIAYYGEQDWWPGEGFEIAVGAVLTQQTNWSNVEIALNKLNNFNGIDAVMKNNVGAVFVQIHSFQVTELLQPIRSVFATLVTATFKLIL